MNVGKFRKDLYELGRKACLDDDDDVRAKVLAIADQLVRLYKKNLVKINHSALELVCARELIREGYDVNVERKLDKQLVCDVYGRRDDGVLIVEIETGFIPPEVALQPTTYSRSRIASKIARYSKFAGRFALGTTPSYVLDFPPFFVKPPRYRTNEEAAEVKKLTDVYYDNPAISLSELLYARIHSVFVIDVDETKTRQVDPETYLQNSRAFVTRGPDA